LLESEIKKINYNGLKDIFEDISKLEHIIEDHSIESCRNTFYELKKIIDFVLDNQMDIKSIEINKSQILEKFQNNNSQELTARVSVILTKLSPSSSLMGGIGNKSPNGKSGGFFGGLFNKK
jgi:hypothetical protein